MTVGCWNYPNHLESWLVVSGITLGNQHGEMSLKTISDQAWKRYLARVCGGLNIDEIRACSLGLSLTYCHPPSKPSWKCSGVLGVLDCRLLGVLA